MNFTIQIVNNTFNTGKLENLNNKKHVREALSQSSDWCAQGLLEATYGDGTQVQMGRLDGFRFHGFPLDGIRMHWMFVFCQSLYPLVNVYITMERSTIFHGKIHYFNGHFQ